jgi:hypothetical protein
MIFFLFQFLISIFFSVVINNKNYNQYFLKSGEIQIRNQIYQSKTWINPNSYKQTENSTWAVIYTQPSYHQGKIHDFGQSAFVLFNNKNSSFSLDLTYFPKRNLNKFLIINGIIHSFLSNNSMSINLTENEQLSIFGFFNGDCITIKGIDFKLLLNKTTNYGISQILLSSMSISMPTTVPNPPTNLNQPTNQNQPPINICFDSKLKINEVKFNDLCNQSKIINFHKDLFCMDDGVCILYLTTNLKLHHYSFFQNNSILIEDFKLITDPTTQTANPTTQTANPTTQTANPTTQTANPTTQNINQNKCNFLDACTCEKFWMFIPEYYYDHDLNYTFDLNMLNPGSNGVVQFKKNLTLFIPGLKNFNSIYTVSNFTSNRKILCFHKNYKLVSINTNYKFINDSCLIINNIDFKNESEVETKTEEHDEKKEIKIQYKKQTNKKLNIELKINNIKNEKNQKKDVTDLEFTLKNKFNVNIKKRIKFLF